jgi:hypothetical protein
MAAQVFSCFGGKSASVWRFSTSQFGSSKGVVSPLAVRIRPALRADSVVRAATSNEGEDKKDAVGSSASPVQTESVTASSGENKTISERRAKGAALDLHMRCLCEHIFSPFPDSLNVQITSLIKIKKTEE